MKSTELLDSTGIDYRLIKLDERAVTSEDVVKFSSDIDETQICKTIIAKTKSEKAYAFLIKGMDRLDAKKVKELIGEKISIVSQEELQRITGLQAGAVCPLVLDIPLFVDSKVFSLQKINFGSGDHLYGIEIEPSALSVVEYTEADISRSMTS